MYSASKKAVGKLGEDLASEYLMRKGFQIIDRNFIIRGGEIDIIAIDKNVVVYVEVKTRSSKNFGLPEESVTYRKIKFLERAAKFYRSKSRNLPDAERIDVIAITFSKGVPQIKYIPNVSG